MEANKVHIRNKRAAFDYLLEDKFTAGLVLTGTEIKSIRQGKGNLVDSFCWIDKGELWVKGMDIPTYSYGSYNNHTARRDRKLLLTKKELHKLQRGLEVPGYTIVPTLLFINEQGWAKLQIALAKGKKEYDKRQSLREKDAQREIREKGGIIRG